MLWHCWLGGRKGIRPVKNDWWGAGVCICLERCADLHMAQLMPLPLTVSCFSKIQIVFIFLVPAHLGGPGQRAVKRVCSLDWRFVWTRHSVQGRNYTVRLGLGAQGSPPYPIARRGPRNRSLHCCFGRHAVSVTAVKKLSNKWKGEGNGTDDHHWWPPQS